MKHNRFNSAPQSGSNEVLGENLDEIMKNAAAEVADSPEASQDTREESGRKAISRVGEILGTPFKPAREKLRQIGEVAARQVYTGVGTGVEAGERVVAARQARLEERSQKSLGYDTFQEHKDMAGDSVHAMDPLDHSPAFAAGWEDAKAKSLKELSDRETDEINERYAAEKQEKKRLAKQQKADAAKARREQRQIDKLHGKALKENERRDKKEAFRARREQRQIDKLHGEALKENERRDEEEAFRQEVERAHGEALEMNAFYDEGFQGFNEAVDISPGFAFEWTPVEDLPSSEGWEAAKSKHIDGLHEEALKMNEQYDIKLAEEKYKELQAKAQRRAEEAQARKEARRARRQERLDTAKELPGRAMRKVGRIAGRGWKAFKASAKGAHEAAQQSLKETADA